MSYAGNPDSAATGFSPAPPPPPPPPPSPGQAPALRINTAELQAARLRRPQNNTNDPYEPPAAIQNAMMTKDKKPFTYTPGMGGKLDLSQIRSPRMARRVAKNANDEGIEGPPKSALEPRAVPSSPNAGNIYVQPQVAVPVFPANMPTQTVNRTPSSHLNRVPSNVSNSQPEPVRIAGRNEGKVTPITIVPNVPSAPQSPTSPPQVTLAKAPTPWLQNKPKQQEELPEWAKRANANKSVDVSVDGSPAYQQPQYQQKESYVQSPSPQPQMVQRQPPIQQDRVVPVRVEDRPSVFSVMNEPGHHQFKQSPNQQQRWGQPQQQNQQAGGTRIIPIMVEDNGQPQARTIPVDVQGGKVVVHRGPAPGPAASAANQAEPGPVQSRSFRVLQKITDTDSDTDVDGNSEQVRKLQLTEDDKVLMNKFKDQVDGETYLHQEEDPRYRGAAIPSRAFRFLQNMTDSGEVPSTSNAPRPPSAINKKQNRNSKSFEETQANLPASEQQVQEPKKYMGSAIPSRSFRILQAMTSPENIAPQENHQQDFNSRTENSVTGNQQSGVFYPNCPSPYWNPESGWWGYYPYQYAPQNNPNNIPPLNVAYNPYAYCGYGDGNSFAYYPMYDQNYAHNYAQNYATQSQAQVQSESESKNQDQVDGQTSCDTSQVQHVDPNYPTHGYIPMPLYPAEQNYRQQTIFEQFSNGVHSAHSLPPKTDTEEPKSSPVAAAVEDPKAANNALKYLTVPKWTNQNRLSINNGKTNDANPEPIDADDRETNGSDDSKTLSSDKDSSGCTISSKTDANRSSETDSESSDSDSESSDSDSSEDSSDSSSSSSDSDSDGEYHAFTTEPKPQVVIAVPAEEPAKSHSDKDCLQSLSATTISEDGFEHSSRLSSDKLSCSDCDSDADDEYQIESLNNDCILPHQLSVIYEDVEQTETESESKKLDCLKENVKESVEQFEETGDPPDDVDNTTVSVSLPLRFKFSVSENNEDVTTVIVGDSTVKSGTRFESEERLSKSCSEPDEGNEVHVNLKIKKSDNTSVDFTLKKQKESFDTEFTITEDQTQINLRETSAESLDAKVTLPEVSTDENDNLKIKRDDVSEAKGLDWKENVETEFTIRRKKTDVTRHVWKKDLDLETEKELETMVKNDEPREDTETEFNVRNKAGSITENGYDSEYEITTSTTAVEENVHKEIVEQKSLKIKERETSQTEFGVKKIRKVKNGEEINDKEAEVEAEEKIEPFDYTAVQNFNTAKRLLSVQNSRDETDDEDSGVTSDMSRIISEVDTDSECASIKRMNKYQRTQTHSRLFKLLNDDAILAEEDSEEDNCYSPAGRREHLTLPLKTNVFNYDENYYSNYSSGITSPDYSPLCEQSWRRIHEGRSLESENSSSVTTPNECVDLGDAMSYGVFQPGDKPAPNDDPYFQTWKKVVSPVVFDYDILPSIAFKKLKKLENGIAGFHAKSNRINVLCPRIKSSKNVPQALQQSPRKATAASSIPFLSTKSSLKNGHC